MSSKSSRRLAAVSISVASLLALFGSGCASIVHGGPRTVNVSSQPAGAKATVIKMPSGEVVHSGTTPMTVNLSPKRGFFKGQAYTLRLETPGFAPAEVAVTPKLSGWYFGNIVFGGLIGMLIVDPATGAMWNLSPDKIDQTLSPEHASVLKDGKGFMVVLVSDTTAKERAAMVRIN